MGGGHGKSGIDTWVDVYKNGSYAFWFGGSNTDKEVDGNNIYNNISRDWIWKLNKDDKVTFIVLNNSYLGAHSDFPLNFNGELVFVET